MDETKLVIHHGGSWMGNCYEGDKLLPEVFVFVSAKETTDCVQYDNLCNLPTSQPVYGRAISGRTLITVMIARYPTLAEVVTTMNIGMMVWVVVLEVLEDMDVLVHWVLQHLTVFPFDRMVWVTMLIKLLNMLPHELGLFLEQKGILLNPLARMKVVQMMADYTRVEYFNARKI
ncbi:hypothetical protein Ddye_004876 [Dipteronia dyeriana]|uniref:Uncharacterized protein n=1 Tax=Dipteronia dyeriana TaxID=168575 RepID=A0AAD9XG07_9ROSI|nr:hypothetical protein Ddye_004876 [Dipteronia dyeriana]